MCDRALARTSSRRTRISLRTDTQCARLRHAWLLLHSSKISRHIMETPPGFEPGISRSVVLRVVHCATESLHCLQPACASETFMNIASLCFEAGPTAVETKRITCALRRHSQSHTANSVRDQNMLTHARLYLVEATHSYEVRNRRSRLYPDCERFFAICMRDYEHGILLHSYES